MNSPETDRDMVLAIQRDLGAVGRLVLGLKRVVRELVSGELRLYLNQIDGVWWAHYKGALIPGKTPSEALRASGDPEAAEILAVAMGESWPASVPKVIVLCGSTRFKVALREWESRLEIEEQCPVIPVSLWSDGPTVFPTADEKEIMDRVHRSKIDLATEVFVVDPGGYVGDSTKAEIEYAQSMGKHVRWLSREVQGWTEADCRYWNKRGGPTITSSGSQ